MLIAVAAIGTYAASTGALTGDTRSVVVASHDLTAGTRLAPGDLRVVKASMSAEASRNLASSPRQLEGTTLLGPLREGELFQAGNVSARSTSPGQPEVSFALPRSRAVAGDLRSGESVDVVVTEKGNEAEPARTAVSGAKVVKVDKGSNGAIGSGGDVLITLSVADRSMASEIATAVDNGQVTLVRTTGLDNA